MRTFDLGDKVWLDASFRDDNPALPEPGTVVCKVLRPDGATVDIYTFGTDPEIERTATRAYRTSVVPATAGVYAYRYEGTDPLQAAGEARFQVRASLFPS